MSRRKVGTSSVTVSVALRMENAARLARMMTAGRNRSEIVDDAVSAYFRRKDATEASSGLGSFAVGLDVDERLKMMRILAASMREEGPEQDSHRLAPLVETLCFVIESLSTELSK